MRFTTPDLCDAWPDDVRVLTLALHSFGGREAFGGPIATVACHEDNSRVREAVESQGAGHVLVVDGGGSLRRALLGDLLAQKAADNGWAGVVVHGAVRDVEMLHGIDLGVQALGRTPVRSDKRGVGDRDVPVSFGGVSFIPGHHAYADANGIVVSERQLVP